MRTSATDKVQNLSLVATRKGIFQIYEKNKKDKDLVVLEYLIEPSATMLLGEWNTKFKWRRIDCRVFYINWTAFLEISADVLWL